MPTSAVPDASSKCTYKDCDNCSEYLVKVENSSGQTAKFHVCGSCNNKNRIWAERHLPPAKDRSEASE